MDIDAIEQSILEAKIRGKKFYAKAREQLDALVIKCSGLEYKAALYDALEQRNAELEAEKEQCRMSERTLKEQCATLEQQARIDLAMIKSLMKDKDTLEQQLNDEKGICEALRSQNSDAVEEVQKLEQQIQQAEKRGYELAMRYGYKHPYGASEVITYEEAKAVADRKHEERVQIMSKNGEKKE